MAAVVHMPSSMLDEAFATALNAFGLGRARTRSQAMGDVEQHNTVDAQAEEHCRRSSRRCRQRHAHESEDTADDDQGQRRRERTDQHEPKAAEYDEQQRQDQPRVIRLCSRCSRA